MKIDYKTKISVKFANGNSMAFLGQGYIVSGDWKDKTEYYVTNVTPIKTQRFHIIDNMLIYNR